MKIRRLFLCLCAVMMVLYLTPAALAVPNVTAVDDKLTRSATPEATAEESSALDNAPVLTNNMGQHNYINANRWTDPAYSALMYDAALQIYTRVEFNGAVTTVETYGADFEYINRILIEPELPIYGGFHSGDSYNFLIYGQENPDEDDSVEVIRVVKYDKNWNRLGHASLYGANTTVPFDAGGMSTAEYNGYLYIRTSHEMYASSDGVHHQANLTMNVRISDMAVTDSFYDVMNNKYGYVSHSFNQYIRVDGSNADLVAVDHGDAHPRSVVLTRYYDSAGQDKFTTLSKVPAGSGSYYYACAETVDLLAIGGESGSNDTGVSVGGFEISDSSYLVVGNTVDQSASFYAGGQRAIFLSVTDKQTLSTAVTYLTGFDSYSDLFNPQLVKINGNKFMIHWTELPDIGNPTHCYVFVDGQGQALTQVYQFETPSCESLMSDCQPIIAQGKVVWYMCAGMKPAFLVIDPADPASIFETHVWYYHINSFPTAAEAGQIYSSCYICGEEHYQTMPELTSEEYIVESSKEPTCETSGEGKYIWCTPHGDWIAFTVTSDPLGHDYSEWVPEGGKHTCGYVECSRTCGRCGNVETETQYFSHEYYTETVEPTCTQPGYDVQYCKLCGGEFGRSSEVPAYGHEWTPWSVIVPNTCIDKGLGGHRCEVCGLEETVEIGYDYHDYEVTEEVEEGCLAGGYTTYTCTVCGDSYTENHGTGLGHWWSTVHESDGIIWTCDRCGYSEKKYFDGRTEVLDPGESPAPVDPGNPFTDVKKGEYYYEPVLWAVENGITNGLSDTIFGVNEDCTRAQFVTFLWRAAGEPEPDSAVNPFEDVLEDQFYTTAVLWAVENGYTTGLAATIFGVNEPCTRDQVVTFLWRYAGKPAPAVSDNPFQDVLAGQFYSDAILWAVEEGITTGLSADTFGVGTPCNRAMVVTFLYRAMT